MHKHTSISIGCTLFLLVSSCNGQKGAHSVEEIVANIEVAKPDTSVYGTLKDISADTLLFTEEFGEGTFTCGYLQAKGLHEIYGSLTQGNRYAMLIDPNEQSALKIVNLTELSGQWFYDIEEQRGFTITAAGALSSINPKDVSFKKWKFQNGKIVIYYTNIDDVVSDTREYKTDTTDINRLSAENLEITFLGQTLNCQRQHGPIKMKFKF